MKLSDTHHSGLVALLLIVHSLSAQGQSNYVATSPASATPSSGNVLVGIGAGNTSIAGGYNAYIGYEAGKSSTTGYSNAFVGASAGRTNTRGTYNTFIGFSAGYSTSTGSYNTFVGNQAGITNTIGQENTAVGQFASSANQSGSGNVAVGSSANFLNAVGSFNVMVGDSAGFNNITSGNTFVGSKSGYNNSTARYNTFLGYHAGYNVTIGSNNIIIGPTSGTAITDGSNNVLMGYNSQADEGIFNGIAIGSNSKVASSNSLILGNGVNVGIGTSAPKNKLEVVAAEADASGLRLTKLTSQGKPTLSTDQFLTVNQQGDVVKARYLLRINNPSEWSDKVFTPSYTLRPLDEVANYVKAHQHLPGIPSAEQVAKEGVDLVKMNTILLEKVEELTLYLIQQQKHSLRQQNKVAHLQQQINALRAENVQIKQRLAKH
ncbi:hypothetical protein GCM10028805_56580 [Spirosoma harenae]